ncbi:MAG TPA: glutamate synthase central domain-containing protein, partial [Spirochaetia bacterium]|nr:glutamate synthase central domain-containing protein [Spirochaetia bacterium]
EGLYDPFFEHDACGVGFVVNVDGRRTHQVVQNGITILKNLVHRGAVGGDSRTGDGAGILVQMPHRFFTGESERLGFVLPAEGQYGVGMLFLPTDAEKRSRARELVEDAVAAGEGSVLGWRDVPVDPQSLGELALHSMPQVSQFFAAFGDLSGDALERRLYVTRKVIESMAAADGFTMEQVYVASLSCRTVVYKGLFVAPQLESFYPDLRDPAFESALAVIHQRYSTNTFPSWHNSQPFRYIAHNGEINTLRGNINKMNARELTMSSPLFGDDISKLVPVIQAAQSDSGIFDNVLELLVTGGRSVEHALMMMVPEAFGARYHMSEDKRAFYEYHAAIMEPWDGPAAISFSDGIKVGSILDRNGLRPARWVVTRSGLVVLASEVGVLPIAPEDVLQKGRLAPGKMFLVDTREKRIIYDHEVKAAVSRRKPYRRWLEANRIELKGLFQVSGPVRADRDALREKQWVFGYSVEDIDMVIAPMVENSQEPISSMGNDQSLAVLSDRPQLLYTYFKQLFAQVTNPPIDPYRENLVMSLMSYVGREKNLLEETPEHVRQVKLPHPILSNDDVAKLRNLDVGGYRSCVIPMTFAAVEGENGLEKALEALFVEAESRVDAGYTMLILTDREVSPERAPIPALLAVSALHHHLTRVKKRHLTALVLETGEAREVHHFATLMGFGASAINPYLAIETIADLKARGRLASSLTLEAAIEHYITAIKKGLLKVMSKMGVSTIRSYKSAQIFEAVGLADDFVRKYFKGTPSRIG